MNLTTGSLAALLQIVVVNVVLSGDNAVVIALAAHRLPAQQRRLAMIFGTAGAILLRVLFTALVGLLLALPFLRLVGGMILTWIALKLLIQEQDAAHQVRQVGTLLGAVWTIIVADCVMSLDNMLAVAAAAKNDLVLLAVGLVFSIAVIMAGSALIAELMNRFPILVVLGASVLGWTAGDMMVADHQLGRFVTTRSETCYTQDWHAELEHWRDQASVDLVSHRHWIGRLVSAGVVVFVVTVPYGCAVVRRLRGSRGSTEAVASSPTDDLRAPGANQSRTR